MLGLKPIKLLPARERVASALRKAIIAQQIKEGETLTLETTAQQLGVSITPVREAFQILERDGLISLQQNRGATVLGINEKTLREHYQVRAVLEKAACELCCENGADLSSVKNCIDTAEEALERNDVTDYANQNQSFHYEIWKAAGNGKLEKMLGELWNGLSLGLNSTEEEYARRSQKEHQQIYAALVMIFPYIILGGTLRVAGGQYSVVTNLTSPSAGGLVIYSNLIFTVQFSTFAMAFGLYMNMVLPTVSAKIFGITIIFLLVGLNLLGINAFAKINNLMSGILLVSMVAYDIYGLTQINQPIFDFSSSQMFTGGFKGFFLATFLLINCCHGYYGLIYFGKEAKSATKDMPFACLMCFPVVVFIYVTLAMVTSGTVPYENANGAATILPAALAILPKPVYYAFVVGGPIMAILTTLNSSIASFRFQPTQAAKDGWLPKAILKENRFGMPPIQLLFMLIMLLIPIVFNVSIVTINYISQIIMFGLGIATLIGIARIPKLYPEAWKKNSFHMSKTALWISVLLSATLYTINFVKAVIVLEPIYAVIAVVAMVVALVLGKVIADRGGLHIETSVWPPKSE